jgi:hypothetical protein
MVEEKMDCCVCSVVKFGHGFGPFSKVIHFYENVLVSITGWRMESNEVYAPLKEGADCYDWV